jgi:hypothetical protein
MIGYLLVIAISLQPLLPSPHDRHGWGLRVHRFPVAGPLLAGEGIGGCEVRISLINFSDRHQLHDPLWVALQSVALELDLRGPDGTPLPTLEMPMGGRDPFTVQTKLPPGAISSVDFHLASFGYSLLEGAGRYRVAARLNVDAKPDGRVISSPPLEFEVLPRKAETLLASCAVPVEGVGTERPRDERVRPTIEQVRVGTRTLLVYRHYNGPKDGGELAATYRLAELSGKCEMKVEGAYGDWGPLTITYADQAAPNETKSLVVHSVTGLPWTEEDQAAYDFNHNIAPAPRLKH